VSIKIDIIGSVLGMFRPVWCFWTRGGRHLCDGSRQLGAHCDRLQL